MTVKTKEGNITATKDTLNYISILAFEASDRFAEKEMDALACKAKNFGNEIFEALEETGYYR